MILTVLIIGAILLAVLVAAAVPALVQLRRTLKSAQVFLDTTGTKLNQTLDESSAAVATLRRASDHIEASAADIARLFEAAGQLGDALNRVNESLRATPAIFGAVAAAAGAAVRAVRASRSERRAAETNGEGGGEGAEPATDARSEGQTTGDRRS